MQDKPQVHRKEGERRVARGIRMAASLWILVEAHAAAVGDETASSLIERWVREKLEAVRKVA